jgi:hypothetical protein
MRYHRRTPSPSGGPLPGAASSQRRGATPSPREQVTAYLNAHRDVMNLRQWTLKVSNDIPADDSWADVEVSENLWEATIRLSADFFKESPESQRRILAHELMHVHNAALERLMGTLSGVLGSQAYEVLDKVWDTEGERVAEALSFVVAGVLPLPEFISAP